jgi:transposase InsO family protein
MKDHASKFSIVEMARIFDVTPSGYYSYCSRGLSKRAIADANLLEEIKTIFYVNQQTYGRYRMYRELKKTGKICSQRRVSRLMKTANLVAKARRRFKVTTKANSDATAAPNKLKQNFKANKPNEKWVSDLTYVWTSAGWLYLAVVMDLFSRKIVGMAMGNRITKDLVCKAFLQAMLRRGYPVGLLYHSDRGSQYTSNDFQQLMQLYKIQVSMSGKGNCYDNAAMESFFHTLKLECTDDINFKTREEAMNNIFDYIEIFYNNQRMHSYSFAGMTIVTY